MPSRCSLRTAAWPCCPPLRPQTSKCSPTAARTSGTPSGPGPRSCTRWAGRADFPHGSGKSAPPSGRAAASRPGCSPRCTAPRGDLWNEEWNVSLINKSILIKICQKQPEKLWGTVGLNKLKIERISKPTLTSSSNAVASRRLASRFQVGVKFVVPPEIPSHFRRVLAVNKIASQVC